MCRLFSFTQEGRSWNLEGRGFIAVCFPFLRTIKKITNSSTATQQSYEAELEIKKQAIYCENWNDENFQQMLDATYFLENGGQKGLQTAVLKPGK